MDTEQLLWWARIRDTQERIAPRPEGRLRRFRGISRQARGAAAAHHGVLSLRTRHARRSADLPELPYAACVGTSADRSDAYGELRRQASREAAGEWRALRARVSRCACRRAHHAARSGACPARGRTARSAIAT